MAETVKRSQLIQQQIENLLKNAPQPYTEAEKNQIMKGRKKQADIDAGRATIEARNKEVNNYNEQVKLLNEQLGKAIDDERAAGKEDAAAAEKAEREKNASPLTQKFLPFAGGAVAGAGYAALANATLDSGERSVNQAINEIGDEIGPTEKLTHSQANRARAVGAANAAEQFKPASRTGKALKFGAKGAAYAAPSALIFNEYNRYVEQANDPNATQADRDMAQAIANGLLGAGTGIGGEGAVRALTTRVDPGVGRSMMRIETARELARRHDDADMRRDTRSALAPTEENRLLRTAPRPSVIDAEVLPEPEPARTLPAPSSQPAEQKSDPVRHSQRFKEAVEATGGKPGKSKSANYAALRKGITDANLPDVAERLNLPRTADRSTVLQRAREMMKTSGKSSLLFPLVAAGTAYMASSNPSEASTGGEAQGNVNALASAGAAGGLTYGTNKLLQALPSSTGTLAGGMTGPLMPMTFDPFEGGSEEDTRHNIMAARGDLNALLPSAGRAIGVTPQEQSAYEMAQVPTPGPSRIQRQADTRQDAEYMRRYLDDEPVNMPVNVPGWQDRAATAPDPFDADLAELASLLAELEGPAEPQRRSAPVVMPNPVMVSPALQNRLLSTM